MLNIFISYNRKSEAVARIVVSDMESLGHVAWFDQDLSGGQVWWDQILEKIRNCDVLAFLMDAHSVESTACKREFEYALALGKTILPIMAADGVSTTLLPPELVQIQFFDYRVLDRNSALKLAKALNSILPSKPLPDPMPPPPEIPVSYLGGLALKIETTSNLSFEEQSALILELKRSLKEPGAANHKRILLKKLRNRHDIYAAIAEEIDDLIGKTTQKSSDFSHTSVSKPITKVVVPKQISTPNLPKSPHKIRNINRFLRAFIGAIAGALFASIYGALLELKNEIYLLAIVGGIVGAIIGAFVSSKNLKLKP